MDTDKIKVFGSKISVDSTAKVAEIELAEKEKMKNKVDKILSHGINVFINRLVSFTDRSFLSLTYIFQFIFIIISRFVNIH